MMNDEIWRDDNDDDYYNFVLLMVISIRRLDVRLAAN